MSTYVDVSAAVHRRAGLGRYASNLSQAVYDAIPDSLALFHNREAGWQPMPWMEHTNVPIRSVGLGYKPWRLLVWLSQLTRIGLDKLLPDADVYHATEHLLMPLRGTPTVLTVHDLIFRLFPEHHKKLNYWYLNLTMPLYCDRANHIITVSNSTREDLRRLYGVPYSKMTVVHEAADSLFRPVSPQAVEAIRAKYGLPDSFALFVGTVEPRKNLVRLLEAIEQLHERDCGLPLVLVGTAGWLYEPILKRMEAMPSGTVARLGYVPDEDLAPLYAAAEFSVQPSLYEGFGLPVLESMACGTPVVCSESSSLPEVGGEAVLYFDPHDVDHMAAAIGQMHSSEELRRDLRQAGLKRAGEFTWQRAARETISVYQRVQAEF